MYLVYWIMLQSRICVFLSCEIVKCPSYVTTPIRTPNPGNPLVISSVFSFREAPLQLLLGGRALERHASYFELHSRTLGIALQRLLLKLTLFSAQIRTP